MLPQPSMSWDFGPSRSEALDAVLRESSPPGCHCRAHPRKVSIHMPVPSTDLVLHKAHSEARGSH
jgi:hypothetical protein